MRLAVVLVVVAGCSQAPSIPRDVFPGSGPAGGDDGGTGAIADDDGGGASAGDGGAVIDSDGGTRIDPAPWHAHADAALVTMLLRYWSPSSSYLLADSPSSDAALTGYWTFAQALDAVLDGVARTDGARFAGWVETLYLSQNTRGFTRDFYDDENWMALALMRAYDRFGDAKYLDEAKALVTDIEAAWDTTCCGAHPGGIWWDRPHTQKATAANAGPVIAAVRLAARTSDATHLAFAKKVYAFWRANMVDPSTFEVYDHIVPAGTIYKYKFTYNEGLMIGAAVELWGATRDAAYLADAEHVAARMLAAETTTTSVGRVLFDGTNSACNNDCQQFKGIGYRYLAALEAADPHPEYATLLSASADAIWTLARGGDGLYATDWAGPAATAASIDAQSSAAMALNLYAASLGNVATGKAGRYEAEDGVIHSVGIEATHGTFSGWAYLAGWNGDGQWVDLRVKTATAGAHTLALRYAAGAGDAARLVYVNGANAIDKLPLPSTGSWDTWATRTATVTLPAGESTVSIIYNGSLGSTGFVNLDYVDLQ